MVTMEFAKRTTMGAGVLHRERCRAAISVSGRGAESGTAESAAPPSSRASSAPALRCAARLPWNRRIATRSASWRRRAATASSWPDPPARNSAWPCLDSRPPGATRHRLSLPSPRRWNPGARAAPAPANWRSGAHRLAAGLRVARPSWMISACNSWMRYPILAGRLQFHLPLAVACTRAFDSGTERCSTSRISSRGIDVGAHVEVQAAGVEVVGLVPKGCAQRYLFRPGRRVARWLRSACWRRTWHAP